MLYYRTPDSFSGLLRTYTFHFSRHARVLYLTFDDGPHPEITPQVLRLLRSRGAHATFFCVGDNLKKYPDVAQQIIDEGHIIGNHTYHHLNGWKSKNLEYLKDFKKAETILETEWFRPPYGKIKPTQAKAVLKSHRIALWDVLSGDYRQDCSPEVCARRVIRHARQGSIIVFHDSEKARENMLYALECTLKYFAARGFRFETLPSSNQK